jgi:hypothetical protein
MADERPRNFVTEAHARGLLTFFEIAELLDIRLTDALDLMFDGHIEYERINNKPCASHAAVEDYQRRVG